MQLIQNIVEWFRSLSNGLKVLVIVVGVVVALLASQAVFVIATIVFVIGLVVLILQAIRRRPLRQWGIVTVAALVLSIVFGAISGASNEGSTTAQRETATSSETAEKAKEKEPEPEPEPAPPRAPEEKAEAEPQKAESKKKEEPEEESTAGIGEVVEVDDGIWIVTSSRQESQLADQFGGIMPPKQGNFIIVDFRFKNDASDSKTLHTAAMKLIDEDGRESDPDTDSFGYIPQEKNVLLEQVNPGVTKEGQVIFSVSPDASGFKLQLRGTSLFTLEEPKEVALGF